jgi:hypothetical protein
MRFKAGDKVHIKDTDMAGAVGTILYTDTSHPFFTEAYLVDIEGPGGFQCWFGEDQLELDFTCAEDETTIPNGQLNYKNEKCKKCHKDTVPLFHVNGVRYCPDCEKDPEPGKKARRKLDIDFDIIDLETDWGKNYDKETLVEEELCMDLEYLLRSE